MWTPRAHDAAVLAISGLLAAGAANAQGSVHPGLVVAAPAPVPGGAEAQDQLLQLEVFVNGRALDLISAFTLRPDGTLTSSFAELSEIGLRIPADLAQEVEIPLARLDGVTFVYDEAGQSIRFTAAPQGLSPVRLAARIVVAEPDPQRPPFGAVANYTLFASADRNAGSLSFGGVAGAFETRIFGHFGLVENSFLARVGGGGPPTFTRLDSSYVYERPDRLTTYQGGDLISGGFSWTRPIRMGGLQIRRSFGLRPDLVTLPLPTLTGSAAAPSMLDLYVNNVRTFGASVQQGPFEIRQPPIVYGAGTARIVLRDALGRETVLTTPFYASPALLAPGLTDFSAEIGFARRNYGVLSNDYDGRIVASASVRRGFGDRLTLEAHAETAGSLLLLGGGAIFTVGTFGLISVAVSGSRTSTGTGALVDLSFESRRSWLSVTVRTQRVFGDYQDVASWTAVLPPNLPNERRIFGQPRELDQISVATPLPWRGGSVGASYIVSRRETETSRLVDLSFTQDIGPFSFFASGVRDFELAGSTAFFVGVSVPLGGGITASGGGSYRRAGMSGYVEASHQGHHEPGAFGWSVRAAAGDRNEVEGIARYGTGFARFEAGILHSGSNISANLLMEGAITFIGGGLHTSQRVDDSFALVEVGAPNVPILRENRLVGRTNGRGQLLVPHLAPFVANRIALDPTDLPIDTEVAAISAVVAPFSRVAILVDLKVERNGDTALITLVDPDGRPLELGSAVQIEGDTESFAVGYDGQAFVGGLAARNVAIVTTPDHAVCRATFDYRTTLGQQVRIERVVCEPVR